MADVSPVEEEHFVTEFRLARDSRSRGLLFMLSEDPNDDVVLEVAANEATPQELLTKLSLHQTAAVRRMLCSNASTPLQTVQDLTLDSDPTVIEAAYHRLGITLK